MDRDAGIQSGSRGVHMETGGLGRAGNGSDKDELFGTLPYLHAEVRKGFASLREDLKSIKLCVIWLAALVSVILLRDILSLMV